MFPGTCLGQNKTNQTKEFASEPSLPDYSGVKMPLEKKGEIRSVSEKLSFIELFSS